jgi:hypothetical protein
MYAFPRANLQWDLIVNGLQEAWKRNEGKFEFRLSPASAGFLLDILVVLHPKNRLSPNYTASKPHSS